QIVERDALSGGKWVLAGDEDVRDRREERAEDESRIPQEFVDDLAVEVVPVEDAHLTAERPDILDDVPRPGFAERELVLLRVAGPHHPDERIDHERVVLRRHPEQAAGRWLTEVALLQQRNLFDDLPGIAKE